jgi:ribonuclease VapC
MVVDTSALLAILLDEDERALFEDLVLRTPPVVMSIVAVVESTISLYGKRREPDADRLDEVLTTLRIDVQPVDLNQGFLARQAFVQYGRRRHPAALNLGDCFTYALAKARNDTLLFKGDDFAKTDIAPAWRP